MVRVRPDFSRRVSFVLRDASRHRIVLCVEGSGQAASLVCSRKISLRD